VKKALTRYRVSASIVGVLLIVLCLVGVPLANFDGTPMWAGDRIPTPNWFDDGSSADEAGEFITGILGTAHGWLYMIFLVMAFSLARKARWDMGFTIVTLICGTIPVLSFWAEHRATRRVRAEFPEETGGRSVTGEPARTP
jgi:integral membrane protein